MELCEPLIFRYFRRYTYFRFSPVYSGADSEYGTLRKNRILPPHFHYTTPYAPKATPFSSARRKRRGFLMSAVSYRQYRAGILSISDIRRRLRSEPCRSDRDSSTFCRNTRRMNKYRFPRHRKPMPTARATAWLPMTRTSCLTRLSSDTARSPCFLSYSHCLIS